MAKVLSPSEIKKRGRAVLNELKKGRKKERIRKRAELRRAAARAKAAAEGLNPTKQRQLNMQLIDAILYGRVQEAKNLLTNGAQPDACDDKKNSAIMIAACGSARIAFDNSGTRFQPNEDRTAIFDFLLSLNADVNAANSLGMTPLMYAAFCGEDEIIKKLIAVGASLHARTNNNQTVYSYALNYANNSGNQSTVDLLRSYGLRA